MDKATLRPVFVNDFPAPVPDDHNAFTHGEYARHTVATVRQRLSVPAKKQASLFKCLQQRTINGRTLGKSADCLFFLTNLVKRQLLLPCELEVLGRAVARGDCVIEPALCHSSQGVDMLRMMAVFLLLLEKSPQIVEEFERLITQARVLSDFEYFSSHGSDYVPEGTLTYENYTVANIKLLQSKLELVLHKCNTFVKRISPMDEEIGQYLKGLLKPLRDEMTSFQCMGQLLNDLNNSENYQLLRSHLIDLIDSLKYGTRSSDQFDGRIDQLAITKVLVLTQSFSRYVTRLGYARSMSLGLDSSDRHQLKELLEYPFFLDKKYVDIMQCRRIDFTVCEKGYLPHRSPKGSEGYLWAYFRGVHFQFDLNYPWGRSTDFNRAVSHCRDGIPSPFLREKYLRNWLIHTGLASNDWLVGLYLELHKWLDESCPEADKAAAITFREKIWDYEYSTLDDFHWLISVIARSGLRPYQRWGSPESIQLLCPNCSFDGQMSRDELFRGSPYVRQLHCQFLALMQQHKRDHDCSVALSIEPVRLRCERSTGL